VDHNSEHEIGEITGVDNNPDKLLERGVPRPERRAESFRESI